MVVAEKKEVKNVPEGYSAVTPWIVSPDSSRLITFLTKAFGAEEIEGRRMVSPEGIITHTEIRIDDAIILMLDAGRSWPQTPAFLRLFVADAEKAYKKALESGARVVTKPTRLSSGEIIARVADPFGNIWWLQEHADDDGRAIDHDRDAKSMKYIQDSLNAELAKRSYPSTL